MKQAIEKKNSLTKNKSVIIFYMITGSDWISN